MVICTICWRIWRTRNSICFDNTPLLAIINMLLLMCSLLDYWTGYKKRNMRQFTNELIPEDLDMVPIQSLSPWPALEMPESLLLDACLCIMSYYMLEFPYM